MYSNDKNSAAEVQAYAKIAGKNWTYFVKSLEITIGRNTDLSKPDEKPVEIDLGPAKVVSRKHATISYNMVNRVWELSVNGRNGAKIDTQRIPCGENAPATVLKSGTVMDIGGTQMMFILPDTPPKVSLSVLNVVTSKVPALADYNNKRPNYGTRYYEDSGSGNTNQLTFSNTYQQPHNLPNVKGFMYNKSGGNNGYFEGGQNQSGANILSTMKASQSAFAHMDTDLSKEEAKDIKPPFSYATMITQAILSNKEGVLSLSEIYEWIASNYAFYRYSKAGWQNSIRHNLSLNKAFEKVPRKPNEPGKGMKWQIADSYKDEFLKGLANGSMSKIRRGSSVSRQLQLHIAMHNNLPVGFKDPNHPNNINSGHIERTHELPQFGQENKSPQHQLQQQLPQNQRNPPTNTFNNNQALSYMAAAAAGADQNKVDEENLGIGNEVKLDQDSLPTPESSSSRGTVLGDSNINNNNNNGNRNEREPRIQTPSPKIPRVSTNSNKENNQRNESTGIDIMSFTSPNKGYTVSALEAYTPERGSSKNGKRLDVSKEAKDGGDVEKAQKPEDIKSPNSENNPMQASPAIWNFVQFTTPSAGTPKFKDSALEMEDGVNGSPIQQRKKGVNKLFREEPELSDLKGVDLVKGFKK